MFKYIVKRLLLGVLILFGVSIILYALVRSMPGDFVINKLVDTQTPDAEERIQQLRELYGLDTNIFGGYIKWMFGDWWMPDSWFYPGSAFGANSFDSRGAIAFDFGTSFLYGEPITEVIADHMWTSFALTFFSLIIYYPLAVFLGTRAAVKQYGAFDYATTVLTMIGISFPSFFLAEIFIKIFVNDLGWFELGPLSPSFSGNGWEMVLNQVWHLILPMFVVVILSIGSVMRYTRTNMLEVLSADYIRTARAKGLSERSVVYKHAFKNTMIPMVTVLAGLLPSLFGGSMILEQCFNLEGIGQVSYNAMNQGDIMFVMGYNMFLAVLTVIGMLLTDIMYVVVDPRVKLT